MTPIAGNANVVDGAVGSVDTGGSVYNLSFSALNLPFSRKMSTAS